MRIFRSIETLHFPFDSAYVAVGVFDGIHLGHQRILHQAVTDAQKVRGKTCVFTFKNHPLSLLAPAFCPKRLMSIEQQSRLIQDAGIDVLVRVLFDHDLACLTPDEFIDLIILKKLKTARLYCGHDFQFGKNGEGTVAFLQRLEKSHSLKTIVIQPAMVDGSIVSSTKIRHMLLEGRIETANKMLGRTFCLEGTVVRGKGIGTKTLGFPTANLKVHQDLLIPAGGVYAVLVHQDTQIYQGMMNIGECPTFGDLPPSLEVHIFNFHKDITGSALSVSFIKHLRKERKFASAHLLRQQLLHDKERALKILSLVNIL